MRSGDARPGLGLLAFAFYAIHAGVHLANGEAQDLWWVCHVATLLVGVGFCLGTAAPIAIGFLWLCVGDALWLLELAGGEPLLPSSLLTHVGGFLLSLYGLRLYGLPRGTWWQAVVALLAMQQLTRWLTPAEANVNVAFAVWKGWEGWFPSYLVYRIVLTAGAAAIFAVLEWLARRALALNAASPEPVAAGGPAGRRRS